MKLTVAQERKLIEDFKNGVTPGKLSSSFKVSPSTVRNIFKRNGIQREKPRGPGRIEPLSRNTEDEIIKLYLSGLSTMNVAREVDIVPSTILKVLRRNAISRREKKRPFALEEDNRLEAAIQYESGKTLCEIASFFDVSTSTISSALVEFGVPSRTGWGKFKTEPWLDLKGNEHVFKSRWELAYAKYLDDQDLDWEYEPKKFILDGYIYTPDFRVQTEHGVEYHEVKGWLDARTIWRIKAFVSRYPEETLRIIGPAEMVALGLAEEYYLNHKMADEVSSLRHQIEGDNHGQNNC
jgi:hypothetical protein